MEITYICHACLLIKVNNVKILTDPWLVGPTFANNHFIFPKPKLTPEDIGVVDFIYFSHGHEDHLQIESIERLNKKNKNSHIIIPDFSESWVEDDLKKLGFSKINKISNHASLELKKNLQIKMFINDLGDIDSSILIKNNKNEVFFQTDNLMSKEEAIYIGKNNNISVAFLQSTLTGIFPGFFELNKHTMYKASIKKRERSHTMAINYAKLLHPKYVVPYACDQIQYGELYYANELHRGNKKEFSQLLKKETKNKIKPIILESCDKVFLQNNKINKLTINKIAYTKNIEKKFLINQNKHSDKLAMSSWAASMTKEFRKYLKIEKKYILKDYSNDLNKFRKKLKYSLKLWTKSKFNVCIIVYDELKDKYFHIYLNYGTKNKKIKLNKINLSVEIPTYRVQNLIRGEYNMGITALSSGGMRIFRPTMNYTENEKYFWKLLEKINFNN
jgi:hypothetical protein